MARKITLSDVTKKQLKILGYLVASAGLAYVLVIVSARPEAIYLTPVINFLIYWVKLELNKEGYLQALRK